MPWVSVYRCVVLSVICILGVACKSSAPKEPGEIVEAFYKAANAGKYAEAKQYLSQDSLRYVEEWRVGAEKETWEAVLDTYTQSRTVSKVQVSDVLMADDVAMCTIRPHFADGSVWRFRVEFSREEGAWRVTWFGVPKAEQTFQKISVRVYGDPDASLRLGWPGESLEIFQDGKRVYTERSVNFAIGHLFGDAATNQLTAVGKDITGKGLPNVVVSEWSGGAHCCFIFHIFEIGKELQKIAELDAGHGDGDTHFADVDGDGRLEVFLRDWSFSYWQTSFADSPAPQVILRYRDGGYWLAPDLMLKAAPTPATVSGRARQVRQHEDWKDAENPPSELWSYMLELIYTGHPELAWQFCNMAWPPQVPGKEAFLMDFRSQLAQSPFWPLDGTKNLSYLHQNY